MTPDELGIVKLLLHQDAHQRQHEGQIGTGADLNPLVRLGGGLRAAGVQGHDLGAILAALGEAHHAAGGHGTDRGVVPHQQDVLGMVEVRQHLVMDVEVARDQIRAQVTRGDAVLHGRGHDVGHLVGHGEGHRPVHVEDAGGPATHHGPLPGFDLGGGLLFGDVVPGLFPTGLAELVLPALATLDPDEGGLDAVGIVGLAQSRLATGADLAPIEG